MSGLASDVVKTWDNAEKALGDSAKNALKGTVAAAFDGEMDQVGDIWEKSWDDMVTKVEGLWDKLLNQPLERAMTGLSNMFEELVMKPVSDWFTGLFSGDGFGIFDVIPSIFGNNGLLDALSAGASFTEAWEFSGLPGYETLESISTWAESLFNGGGLATLESGAAGVASYLGLDSIATWLADAALEAQYGGYEAAMAAAYQAQYGGAAAASSQTGSLSSLATMFASPGGAMAMAVLPGMAGMMLSNMGFLMDGPMTPEEAVSNWQGNQDYMQRMSGQMQSQGLSFEDSSTGFGLGNFSLFSQSAQDAAQALEHLHTVAGYSQEQIDALVASLDPLTQEFLVSGQAANELEGQVSGLAQEMNASINSYTMTSAATREYNQRIDALAERLGLTGEAARSFREQIWELAQGFNSGGEEAQQFEQKLNDFVGKTLNSLTRGAQDGTKALKSLISSMSQAQGQGGSLAGLGASGDGVSLGTMHGGGYVLGWPKAHSGALISALAHDEVPLIARRGEYVVRAEAVTATTLPALKALNQGGELPAASPAVNLHVEIHGNLLGSRDNLEDLARLLESKLRDLERSRWRA